MWDYRKKIINARTTQSQFCMPILDEIVVSNHDSPVGRGHVGNIVIKLNTLVSQMADQKKVSSKIIA